MKIGCNYFLETEQLLDEKAIDIDYFKYPADGFHMDIMQDLNSFELFCNKLTAKRPILLHGLCPAPHELSSPDLKKDFDDKTADRLIELTKTPGVSFHPTFSPPPKDAPFTKTLGIIIENAAFVKEKYAHMEFVSIENLDNSKWGDLIKPEIITDLINESGCDFLLDISHAYCASKALNVNFYYYLKSLPLEKTVEIHINGWIENENGRICHTIIHDEAYQALKLILQHCNPEIITVEYGRSNDRIGSGCPLMSPDKINNDAKKEIIEQISRIKEIIYH